MKKYTFILLFISQIFATEQYVVQNAHTITYSQALGAEALFIKKQYAYKSTIEFITEMDDYARTIINYLIYNELETYESLIQKFNEERVMFLTTGPIRQFSSGSDCFPSVPGNLKEYYTRHNNVSLINPPPVIKESVREETTWYASFFSFFSSEGVSSVGLSKTSSEQSSTANESHALYNDKNIGQFDASYSIKKRQ
ncbi:MAG: hypothetical protein CNLJKLNK_00879 [Holosporales bacterium]